MKKLFTLLTIAILFSCSSEDNKQVKKDPIIYKYGYDQTKYVFEERKVKRGDTFGDILEDEGIDYPEIYQAIQTTKDDVSFRKLQLGKPYTLIFTNDSIISFQNNNKEPKKLKLEKIKKGKGYINSTGEMIKQEMDFSEKNYISITDLHRIMKILFFPEKFNEKESKYYSINKRVISKKILDYLNKYKRQKIYEVSYSRNKYFEQICKYLKKNRGICILIDYGYNKKLESFTLQAIYNHKKTSIFENIGQQDISSHVNFNELIEIAKQHKLQINEFITQRDFLLKYGILERKKKLLTKNSNLNKNLLDEEVDRLINVDRMGNLFKCLVVSSL